MDRLAGLLVAPLVYGCMAGDRQVVVDLGAAQRLITKY